MVYLVQLEQLDTLGQQAKLVKLEQLVTPGHPATQVQQVLPGKLAQLV